MRPHRRKRDCMKQEMSRRQFLGGMGVCAMGAAASIPAADALTRSFPRRPLSAVPARKAEVPLYSDDLGQGRAPVDRRYLRSRLSGDSVPRHCREGISAGRTARHPRPARPSPSLRFPAAPSTSILPPKKSRSPCTSPTRSMCAMPAAYICRFSQTPEDLDRILAASDPRYVGLELDTGAPLCRRWRSC
jgi:hypothetical protein